MPLFFWNTLFFIIFNILIYQIELIYKKINFINFFILYFTLVLEKQIIFIDFITIICECLYLWLYDFFIKTHCHIKTKIGKCKWGKTLERRWCKDTRYRWIFRRLMEYAINFLSQRSKKCRDIRATVTLMCAFTGKMIYKEKTIDFLVSAENSCVENNLDFFLIVNVEKTCLLKKILYKIFIFFCFFFINMFEKYIIIHISFTSDNKKWKRNKFRDSSYIYTYLRKKLFS